MRCPTNVPVGSPGVTLSGVKLEFPTDGDWAGRRAGDCEDSRAEVDWAAAVWAGRLALSPELGKMVSEMVEQPTRTNAVPASATRDFFIDNTVGSGKTLGSESQIKSRPSLLYCGGPANLPVRRVFLFRERVDPLAILTNGSTGDKAHLLGMTWIYWTTLDSYFVSFLLEAGALLARPSRIE